jgi:hypothetical protein
MSWSLRKRDDGQLFHGPVRTSTARITVFILFMGSSMVLAVFTVSMSRRTTRHCSPLNLRHYRLAEV